MKGLFIPGITTEMFRNGCLESIEALIAEGELYDIEYSQWIPVKTRPMDEEEKRYWEEHYGYTFGEDYDGVMFDCPMPEDGQEVWVCSKCGNVWQDTCEVDVGIGLEGNGDWDDIVAWMPFERPKPWKGEADD